MFTKPKKRWRIALHACTRKPACRSKKRIINDLVPKTKDRPNRRSFVYWQLIIFYTTTPFGFTPYSFSPSLLSITINTSSQIAPTIGIKPIKIIQPLFPQIPQLFDLNSGILLTQTARVNKLLYLFQARRI